MFVCHSVETRRESKGSSCFKAVCLLIRFTCVYLPCWARNKHAHYEFSPRGQGIPIMSLWSFLLPFMFGDRCVCVFVTAPARRAHASHSTVATEAAMAGGNPPSQVVFRDHTQDVVDAAPCCVCWEALAGTDKSRSAYFAWEFGPSCFVTDVLKQLLQGEGPNRVFPKYGAQRKSIGICCR